MTKIISIILAVIVFVVGLSILMAWPFLWIWNYAVVEALTIAKPIESFWVAFWLMMFISGFLVKANKGD